MAAAKEAGGGLPDSVREIPEEERCTLLRERADCRPLLPPVAPRRPASGVVPAWLRALCSGDRGRSCITPRVQPATVALGCRCVWGGDAEGTR